MIIHKICIFVVRPHTNFMKEKYIKPGDFAERSILESIIDYTYKPNDKLPPERELAESLGITRPTLREVLQRLGREGWITITHGKPTIVNNFKEDGGMGILKTLSKIEGLAPEYMIKDWLEFRSMVLPEIAQNAVWNNFDAVKEQLSILPSLKDNNEEFASFDSNLQSTFVTYGNNSIVKMIFNDIKDAYRLHTISYFSYTESKDLSLDYYKKLKHELTNNRDNIREIVCEAMKESLELWNRSNMNDNE